MKKAFLIHIAVFILFFMLGGCGFKEIKPDGGGLNSGSPQETSPPATQPPVNTVNSAGLDEITQIALSSTCATDAHDVQGKPPKSYLKGSALSFAKAVCNPSDEVTIITSQAVGDASKDALAHYGVKPATAQERLEVIYSLMLGSAARESSWRWCVGKDPSASNTSSETCEAGLYQTSYNSRSASPALPRLFAKYKADKSGCFATEYKGATKCTDANLKNWGTGEGVEFQKLSKECPGFATEYHGIMLRTRRSHYGPINIKKSLIKQSCTKMFNQIRNKIEQKPELCSLFNK